MRCRPYSLTVGYLLPIWQACLARLPWWWKEWVLRAERLCSASVHSVSCLLFEMLVPAISTTLTGAYSCVSPPWWWCGSLLKVARGKSTGQDKSWSCGEIRVAITLLWDEKLQASGPIGTFCLTVCVGGGREELSNEVLFFFLHREKARRLEGSSFALGYKAESLFNSLSTRENLLLQRGKKGETLKKNSNLCF